MYKNKRLALARARFIWLLLFERYVITKMTKQKNTASLEERERIIHKQSEIDRLLSELIQWQIKI